MKQDLVLKKPIITEKSMTLAQMGQFTFEVDKMANKFMISQMLKTLFKVDVVDIKISAIRGKIKRFGMKRYPSQLSDSKKAIVTLKKGQKIDLFEIKEEK